MSLSGRRIGRSDLRVNPIGFGCWPIAGVSSLNVTEESSLETLNAALDSGINFFDTAFGYGFNGEADHLLAKLIQNRRQEMILASKVGIGFDSEKQRFVDGRPATLLKQAEQVLDRLKVSEVEIMYLHAVDPETPIEESAGAIAEIVTRGWARYAGVSNVTASELERFHQECPVVAVQPPFNMLQQEQVSELRSICEREQIAIVSYWALMKGLLTGKFARDHEFDPRDKRLTYEIYQGQAWQQSQDFLDQLRTLANEVGCSVSQLVMAWTIRQPGITVALCGAKRPSQIRETSQAASLALPPETLGIIDSWILKTDIGV